MSAATLIYDRLNGNAVGVADRVSPELRTAGNILPCVVYSIQSDTRLDSLALTNHRYLARVSVACLGSSQAAAETLATSCRTLLHGQTWTTGASTAYACYVHDGSAGVIEDSEPGGLDLARTITLTLDLYHS